MNDGDLVLRALLAGISDDVQKRLDALLHGLPASSNGAALDAHVAAKALVPGRKNGTLELTELLTPTYFHEYLQTTCAELPKAKVKRLAASVRELEQTATYQLLAQQSTGQFQQAWLDSALAHLERFDELARVHAKIEEAARSGRQKGGRNRRRDAPRLLRLAVRFLRTKAPESKWKNQTRAADTLGALLSAVALKYDLQASKLDATWAQNVVDLIRKDPRAAEVFRRHSRGTTATSAPRAGA